MARPPLLLVVAIAAAAASPPPLLFDALSAVRFLNAGEVRAADASSLVWLDVRQEDTEPENITINPYTWLPQGPWAYYGQARYLFSNASGAPAPPPLGLRSAVPLGGVGAGALELRGDGTVHSVTIVNQSPAGAAKFGVLADFLLAVRAGGDARSVRTQAPQQARGRGVAQITYSGSHPVSRLALADATLPAQLDGARVFALSTLVPGDMAASATPAVAFALAASNPTAEAANVSFFLSLPFAAVNDCLRNGSETGLVASLPGLPGYAACMRACAANAACASWSFDADGLCALNRFLVLSVFSQGAYCGVPGAWSFDGSAALTLSMVPPGYEPTTARGNRSSAVGDVTLRGLDDDGAGGGAGSASVSAAVADDPASLFAAFEASGGFAAGAPGLIATGGAGIAFRNVTAAHGAVAVTVLLAPGARAALSLVFAWSFPDRMHCGQQPCSCRHGDNGCCGAPDPDTLVLCEQLLGNFYANLFADSAAAAASLAADPRDLAGAVATLQAHHAVFSSPRSSLPVWLQDAAVNQASHYRTLMFFRDGRARQWEALDCPDVDSVHNDYQRHLLYLWLMPQFEFSKMRAWGSFGQDPDGHIVENIASFSLGPMDEPGGRVMADTSSVFVLELLELWRHTADQALLAELWPSAARATAWMVQNAAELGLPLHLVSTYDMLGIESHNVTTYNSMLFLAAMRAASTLAALLGDAATQALADAAFARGQAATRALLFVPADGKGGGGFFRAFQGGAPGNESAVMSDCLYGQMIALQLGLGWLLPQELVESHLTVEIRNLNRFGMRVMSDPNAAPTGDTNWMNGPATWSYLSLSLLSEGMSTGSAAPPAAAIAAALDPTMRVAENYRSRLMDLWDLHGLTTGENEGDPENVVGQPFITSHYGFFLTSLFLLGALSGQQTDLGSGRLAFAPLFACPFEVPLLLAGRTGTVACDAGGTFTVALAFGELQLPAGGLSVNGEVYAGAVVLAAGESVSW